MFADCFPCLFANTLQTLEDVDLTVLAATSVLSDLVDKCPPAEACRDAFDRMSKATIKMCMSTTGFGSQVKFSKQQDDSPVVPHHFERQIPPQPNYISMSSRPPPRFDDNWKDLFPEHCLTSDGRSSGNQPSQYRAPQLNVPYAAHRPSFSLSDSSSLSAGMGSIPTIMPHQQQQQQPPQQYDPSLISETSTPSLSTSNGLSTYDSMYDFDFLMSNDDATFTGDSGINHGFESQNWADGGLVPDLFGGLFFGGPAGEGAPVDTNAGYAMEGDFGDAHSSAAMSMWTGEQDGN